MIMRMKMIMMMKIIMMRTMMMTMMIMKVNNIKCPLHKYQLNTDCFESFFVSQFCILTEEDTSNNGGTESETELIYRNYEILSDFYKKHFVDLRVLDTSCEPTR